MKTRLDLHNELLKICDNVYFQPPSTLALVYPAIVYSLRDIQNVNADNTKYAINKSYKITVIDEDPESPMIDKLACLPYCRYETSFVSERLNHTVFAIYY